MGKTRLLHAVADRALAAPLPVLHGGAVEAEGMPPYLPFLEALGRYIAQADPDLLRMQLGDSGPILAPLFPEIMARLGPQPVRYPLPDEQARLRLYDAIGRLLSAIATPAPLLFLLDDLHWADPATLDLLAHLARQLSAGGGAKRILVVGACREGEITHRLAFERAIVELNRLRRLTMLTLGALDEAAIGQIAMIALGAQL
jgi:predicted ATPase